jgi:hypothetical protein
VARRARSNHRSRAVEVRRNGLLWRKRFLSARKKEIESNKKRIRRRKMTEGERPRGRLKERTGDGEATAVL